MEVAAELAQRKPLGSLSALEESTHIGHRQFRAAYGPADEACRLLAIRLRNCLNTLSDAFTRPLVAAVPEPSELRAALVELVALKDLKARIGDLQREAVEENEELRHRLAEDYLNRKWKAWAAARAALNTIPAPAEPKEGSVEQKPGTGSA
jgi:hypothetical protein